MSGIIYKVTNQVNDKVYIGQTVRGLSQRKAQHIYKAIKFNSKYHFHNAIRKYGIEQFEWSIIWEGDTELLSEMEIYFIKKYDSYSNGYNMTLGGEGNFIDETIYELKHINGNTFKGLKSEISKELNIRVDVLYNKQKSTKGWMLVDTNVNSIKKDTEVYKFINKDTSIFLGTRESFIKFTGIDRRHISKIINKKDTSTFGWKLENINLLK